MEPSLTMVCVDYEWFEPLIDGRVTPDDVHLDTITEIPHEERHRRLMAGDFDVAEFSIGTYITGWRDLSFTAIPAFPRRFFPHSRVFVNETAGIDSLADLEGKRVCINSYQNTLALWLRGILGEYHDVDLASIQWYRSKSEPVDVDPPYELEHVDHGSRVRQLETGAIDALVTPDTGPLYPLHENVSRLCEDLQGAEGAYHDRTGFYPLMHLVGIADELVEKFPWVPAEILDAIQRSQTVFADRATYESKYPLVWWQLYREREFEQFGDVWASSFSFDPNADELEIMIRYAHRQGLIDEPFDPREMFVGLD